MRERPVTAGGLVQDGPAGSERAGDERRRARNVAERTAVVIPQRPRLSAPVPTTRSAVTHGWAWTGLWPILGTGARAAWAPRAAANSVVAPTTGGQSGAMTSFISHTTIDCRNAYELSEWWKPVLGYVDLEDDPNEPGHEECMIRDPETGHQVLFIEVPDATPGKNRIHFDLRPRERTPRRGGRAGCSRTAPPQVGRPPRQLRARAAAG